MQPLKHNVTQELISATSALRTEVTVKPMINEDNSPMYISEAEPLVAHSIEHIQASIELIQDAKKQLSILKHHLEPADSLIVFNIIEKL